MDILYGAEESAVGFRLSHEYSPKARAVNETKPNGGHEVTGAAFFTFYGTAYDQIERYAAEMKDGHLLIYLDRDEKKHTEEVYRSPGIRRKPEREAVQGPPLGVARCRLLLAAPQPVEGANVSLLAPTRCLSKVLWSIAPISRRVEWGAAVLGAGEKLERLRRVGGQSQKFWPPAGSGSPVEASDKATHRNFGSTLDTGGPGTLPRRVRSLTSTLPVAFDPAAVERESCPPG